MKKKKLKKNMNIQEFLYKINFLSNYNYVFLANLEKKKKNGFFVNFCIIIKQKKISVEIFVDI